MVREVIVKHVVLFNLLTKRGCKRMDRGVCLGARKGRTYLLLAMELVSATLIFSIYAKRLLQEARLDTATRDLMIHRTD
jgi:hypothetical protein